MAAGLLSMVCRLTIGKRGYEEFQEELAGLLKDAEERRSTLQHLAVRDAEAYDQVSKAFKMDRSTPEAKDRRKEAIQEALKGAADVPMETAESCVDLLRISLDVAEKGNVNVLSDAGTAAHLAHAGFHGAALNVEINLASIKAEDFVLRLRSRLKAMEKEAIRLHKELLQIVSGRLR
jgi:formiminotetrahydrofolate cyclodeaminase